MKKKIEKEPKHPKEEKVMEPKKVKKQKFEEPEFIEEITPDEKPKKTEKSKSC